MVSDLSLRRIVTLGVIGLYYMRGLANRAALAGYFDIVNCEIFFFVGIYLYI